MTVGGLGEFGLIARVTARLPRGRQTLLGPGDDAALVRAWDGRVVATTDLLVEGRHFRREWSSGYDVGRKAAAQNLADVAAMGALPTALLVGLACPGELPVRWAEEFAAGLGDEASLVGAGVVGGDVVASPVLTVAVTALGSMEGMAPVTRGGARPGDLVAVAGSLGRSAAGLALLEAGDDGLLRRFAGLVAAHRRPSPPYLDGPGLARLGASAMLDVSDGLAQDLGHVADASGVEVDLAEGRLRLLVDDELDAAARALGVDPLDWVLRGGEDHALACTGPPGIAGRARVIGRVNPGAGTYLDGQELRGGFDHFAL